MLIIATEKYKFPEQSEFTINTIPASDQPKFTTKNTITKIKLKLKDLKTGTNSKIALPYDSINK